MSFDEAVKIVNTLGGASFATLLVIILAGNKARLWRWGQDFLDLEARHAAEKAELLERADAEAKIRDEQITFWRDIALRNTGILETQTEQLMHVATQVGAVNRKLLAGGGK